MTTDAFIVDACRTPMGGFQGELASLSAPRLGAHAIRTLIERTGVDGASIDEVLMGNVLAAGLRQAPARQAMRLAGLPDSVPATTVNKVCGSGMRTVMIAADRIRVGDARAVIAGGMESMSNAPYLLTRARGGMRMGHGDVLDHMFTDGLEDAETGRAMGTFAQDTADRHQVGREAMDAYALGSLDRALQATRNGWLEREMAPVTLETRDGTQVVRDDEQPRRARPERIPTLRGAFRADGTVTAANSSSISDGASAVLVASQEYCTAHGLRPLARIVGHAASARHPSEFTLAPIDAIGRLLERLGWTADGVDLFEINEAFAMVTMLAIRELGLDPARVNVNGGACAQGHPIGSTGARLVVTLAHALQRTGGRRGIASLCIGGGEATAIALERC